MKIIDLTLPLYTGAPVYPGDAEISIELNSTLEKDGWNMRRIQINSHDGTHVNAPIHGDPIGKTLDDYPLESFCGPAVIYTSREAIDPNFGLIFRDRNIDQETARKILQVRPPFVGLSSRFEVDLGIEKDFLRAGIILFERLVDTELLPREFMFYGMPLRIKDGDGSPVRAFAVIE